MERGEEVIDHVLSEFEVPYEARWGEHLFLVGSDAALGEWEAARGVPMQWKEDNLWVTPRPVQLPAELDVEYKYAVYSEWDDTYRFAEGPNYSVRLSPESQGVVWVVRDKWQQQEPYQHEVVYRPQVDCPRIKSLYDDAMPVHVSSVPRECMYCGDCIMPHMCAPMCQKLRDMRAAQANKR